MVLIQLSDLIRKKKRSEDLLGRYGCDKFIILPRGEADREEINRQCERIRAAVESFKFYHADSCVKLTISIGFHLDTPNTGKVESMIDDLIDKAEQALYSAKNKGKNQIWEFYDYY